MTTDPNEAAFPTLHPDGTEYGGLTKREYFALHLMAALTVNSENSWAPDAKCAVLGADALIAALTGEP